VYLALNKDTGHLFAVKQIEFASGHTRSEKEMAALENELELLRGLWSPYIVGYLGTERTAENGENILNIFLEYMPGGEDVFEASMAISYYLMRGLWLPKYGVSGQ
jgi:serine/threonine protein kinase